MNACPVPCGGRVVRLLVALCLCFAAPALAQPVLSTGSWRMRMDRSIRDTVLANGLTIIVNENRTTPVTTVIVAFRGGAAMQDPGDEGLAHLAEHYLFRAYGNEGAFESEVASLNGTYNGWTSAEGVGYYITVPSKGAVSAIGVMSRLVRTTKFNERVLNAEKRVVMNELARDAGASSILRTGLGSRMWGMEWTRKDVSGSPLSIELLKPSHLRSMLATQYVPSNAAVIIAGDVDASGAIAEASRRFGDWPPAQSQSPADLAPSTIKPTGTTAVFSDSAPDVSLVTLSIQWPGARVRQSPHDARAAELFAEMVNSGVSPAMGRLINSGSVHSLSMSAETADGRGPVTLTVVLTPDDIDRAAAALRAELDRFASSDYLNATLVAAGRKRLVHKAEGWLESSAVASQMIASMWTVADLDYFRSYGDAVAQTDLAQVSTFVKAYIAGRPFVAGAVGPGTHVDRVRAALATHFGGNAP